jgi:hypothetical protein
MPRSKPKYVSRNIRKQWKEGHMGKTIIALREKKVGTEMFYCISILVIPLSINLSSVDIYIFRSFPLFQQIFKVAHVWTPLTLGDHFDWLYKN